MGTAENAVLEQTTPEQSLAEACQWEGHARHAVETLNTWISDYKPPDGVLIAILVNTLARLIAENTTTGTINHDLDTVWMQIEHAVVHYHYNR